MSYFFYHFCKILISLDQIEDHDDESDEEQFAPPNQAQGGYPGGGAGGQPAYDITKDPLRFEPDLRRMRKHEHLQRNYESATRYTGANAAINRTNDPPANYRGAAGGLRNPSTRDVVSSQILDSGRYKDVVQEASHDPYGAPGQNPVSQSANL